MGGGPGRARGALDVRGRRWLAGRGPFRELRVVRGHVRHGRRRRRLALGLSLQKGVRDLPERLRIEPEDRLGDQVGGVVHFRPDAGGLQHLVQEEEGRADHGGPRDHRVARGVAGGCDAQRLTAGDDPLDDPLARQPLPAQVLKLPMVRELARGQGAGDADLRPEHEAEEAGVLGHEPQEGARDPLEGDQRIGGRALGLPEALGHHPRALGRDGHAQPEHPATLALLAEDQVGSRAALPRPLGHLAQLERRVGVVEDAQAGVDQELPQLLARASRRRLHAICASFVDRGRPHRQGGPRG